MDVNDLKLRELRVVEHGLNTIAKRMKAFKINRYIFHTQAHDEINETQKHGVMVEVDGKPYHGKITDILSWFTFLNRK